MIYAVVAGTVILFMAFGVRENPAVVEEDRPGFVAAIRDILTSRHFWTIGVVSACYGSAMALVLNGLRLYVDYTLGGDALDATIRSEERRVGKAGSAGGTTWH